MFKFSYTILIGLVCAVHWFDWCAAATLTKHYGQRLAQTNAYLPPTFGHTHYGEKTTRSSGGSGGGGGSLQTPEHYEPNYSSYVPPASGQVSAQYSRMQQTSKIPLSTLLPQSVIEQFATPVASTYETQHQQQQHVHYQQEQQQQQHEHETHHHLAATAVNEDTHAVADIAANELAQPVPAPMLMVEEPLTMYLTASQNKTLEAAKLLATTLLEAQQNDDDVDDNNNNNNTNDDVAHDDGDAADDDDDVAIDIRSHGTNAGEENQHHLQHHHHHNQHQHYSSALRNGVATSDFNALNRTDIVVVKAHKNAYIIPAPVVARDGTSRLNARELYAKRNQLPKAYTINQFVFIIKPERINFLNKLV